MKKLLFILCIAWLSLYTAHAQSSPDNFRPETNVTFEKSTLPLVFITVNGKEIQKEDKILASMKVVSNADGVNYTDLTAHPDQKIDWEGPVTIKYRGNSSFYNSKKKPFAIRPLKEANLNSKKEKVSLLGMGKDNDWALLAPWEDKAYMRDVLTMELARGGHTFAPHMKYCEVFVDGWYYGIYILSERATKGASRLNLNDPTADDMTGDFHVEIDRDDEDHYYYSKYHPVKTDGTVLTEKKITYQYKEPEFDDFGDLYDGVEQAIQREIDKMEDAFAATDYTNPEKGYRQYIDVASFIDLEIAQELANNIDGYRLSSPLYKYSETHAKKLGDNAKWKTALWDFNIAYGEANYFNSAGNIWRYNTNDMLYEQKDNQLVPFFWHKLMNDPEYVAELKARWKEQRGKNYSDSYITQKIDSLGSVLQTSGALERDKQAWGHFGDFNSEVSKLRSFITRRLRFMDKGWLDAETAPSDYAPVAIGSGFNADVIAEGEPTATSTTDGLDDSGYIFYTSALNDNGALSDDTRTITSASGIDYRLADYNGNNALLMKNTSEGTLTPETPIQTEGVGCLVICTDGSSDLTVYATYTDGTTSNSVTRHIADWYSSTEDGDEAVYGLARAQRNTGQTQYDTRYNFRLYEILLPTDAGKSIRSLTFSRTDGHPSVFAISAKKQTSVGIGEIPATGAQPAIGEIYGTDGTRRATLGKGINIVRYSDGTVRKQMGNNP